MVSHIVRSREVHEEGILFNHFHLNQHVLLCRQFFVALICQVWVCSLFECGQLGIFFERRIFYKLHTNMAFSACVLQCGLLMLALEQMFFDNIHIYKACWLHVFFGFLFLHVFYCVYLGLLTKGRIFDKLCMYITSHFYAFFCDDILRNVWQKNAFYKRGIKMAFHRQLKEDF